MIIIKPSINQLTINIVKFIIASFMTGKIRLIIVDLMGLVVIISKQLVVIETKAIINSLVVADWDKLIIDFRVLPNRNSF